MSYTDAVIPKNMSDVLGNSTETVLQSWNVPMRGVLKLDLYIRDLYSFSVSFTFSCGRFW